MRTINRREFLRIAGAAGAAIAGLTPQFGLFGGENQAGSAAKLVVVHNGNPSSMVQKAIDALGGINRFVKKGDVVVVKPNIGWDRVPEQAATTNPEVVAEIVRLCLKAGASKVKVFDRTCNEPRRCYHRSQIEQLARQAGAEVSHIYDQKFKAAAIPNGQQLKSWPFYADALEADVFINVPIAKHHSLSRVTLGMKNMMGIIGGNRGEIHNRFDQKIVDLNTVIKPQLTIIDAVRILMNNGPQGGNLNDVKEMNTIIAGVDPVAVDAYAATLFGLRPAELGFLVEAQRRGLGSFDLNRMNIEKIDLKG